MGRSILKRVDEAIALPKSDRPVILPKIKKNIDPIVKNRIKILKRWRDQQVTKQNMDPSLIFTNAQIASLANTNPHDPNQLDEIPEIRKWQKILFGEQVCSILNSID
jgi:ribonuclease D